MNDVWDCPFRSQKMKEAEVRLAAKGINKYGIEANAEVIRESLEKRQPGSSRSASGSSNLYIENIACFVLKDDCIGVAESDSEQPFVHSSGEGVTRVLQWLSLKKKKVFQSIEEEFRTYVPEVEELTFERADQGKWFLQVLEKGFEEPVSLTQLSAGTRTILALLTIIHQPNRPELILLEDIEHAIHPRGLAPLVETMRRMAKEHGVQFIFTTQSPYVLDCFQKPEYWDDVVIVEKKDGVSTLTNAKDRLVALGYEREMENLPLGDLWYSGALGGVAGPNELWDEPESKL
jgi:hypothetical protein